MICHQIFLPIWDKNAGYGFPRSVFMEKTILVTITRRSTTQRTANRWLNTFFIELGQIYILIKTRDQKTNCCLEISLQYPRKKISNFLKGATKKITIKTSHFVWSSEKIQDPLELASIKTFFWGSHTKFFWPPHPNFTLNVKFLGYFFGGSPKTIVYLQKKW